MLTYLQQGPVTFIWWQFRKRYISHQWLKHENYSSKMSLKSPRGPWVNHLVTLRCYFGVYFPRYEARGNKHYYNLTVWILVWNDKFFHGSRLDLATYAWRQVILCVTKASTCHRTLQANHWHCLWKIPPIIAVKSNITIFIHIPRFLVNMFYCGRVAFTVFVHANIKGLKLRLMSTVSLYAGYCEATIPVI